MNNFYFSGNEIKMQKWAGGQVGWWAGRLVDRYTDLLISCLFAEKKILNENSC